MSTSHESQQRCRIADPISSHEETSWARRSRSPFCRPSSAPALTLAVTRSASAPATSRPARTADGKPNFSGIWQANNEAHWDLQAHEARPGIVTQPGVYPVRVRAGARGAGARARRRGGCARIDRRGRGRRPDSVQAGSGRDRRRRTARTGSIAIPSSSAICRAFRARCTCRIRFRSSRARTRFRWPTPSRTRRARSTWTRSRVRPTTPTWAIRSAAGRATRSSST